jgi:hypothetical protein
MSGMASSRRKSPDPLDRIKRLAVVAMFSDDALLDRLVLKGGNALDLVLGVSTRASIDLDFSIERAFEASELELLPGRIEYRLRQTFAPAGYTVFDVTLQERPERVTPDVVDFWGGYLLTFKLIETARFTELGGQLEEVRRRAISLGPRDRTRFEIDISKFEHCSGKRRVDFDGYTIYVYTPEMMVCEKLRAICQQMPEYGRLVHRRPAPRARDFLDIHDTVHRFQIDLAAHAHWNLLARVFAAKRVPLGSMARIGEQREFHRTDWPAVQASIRPGVRLMPFDSYFDFVLDLVRRLEPLGDV